MRTGDDRQWLAGSCCTCCALCTRKQMRHALARPCNREAETGVCTCGRDTLACRPLATRQGGGSGVSPDFFPFLCPAWQVDSQTGPSIEHKMSTR